MKLTEEQLAHYGREGYVVLEHVFGDGEIDGIRSVIDRLDEESEKRLAEADDFISIGGQINFTSNLNFLDPSLQAFAADERFAGIATSILGPDVRLYWDQSVYKRPEAQRDFPWHQDNGYAPIEPMHYLTIWLALEDATIENGCVWVLPGSHRNGLVEHVKTDIGMVCYQGDDPGIPVELKKGSLVAFHSLLFHRSTPNRSRSTRKGYVLQYSRLGSVNPDTGAEYRNGPVVARSGRPAYAGFQDRAQV